MVVWFAFGLLIGAVMGIVPFVVVARRWNTKVTANSASANSVSPKLPDIVEAMQALGYWLPPTHLQTRAETGAQAMYNFIARQLRA